MFAVMLHIFYKDVVESAIQSTVICWRSSIRASDLKKLNKLIKKVGSVLELILLRKTLYKMKNIMDNPGHLLHETVIQQQCLHSKASSDLLQYRPLQEIFPAQPSTVNHRRDLNNDNDCKNQFPVGN